MKQFCLLLFTLLSITTYAQKKILGPDVYDKWNRIEQTQLSNSGNFTTYVIRPFKGDSWLFIRNNSTGKLDSIKRGTEAKISGNEKFILFKLNPGYDTIRKLELKKTPKDKMPKDTLAIYYLESGKIEKKGGVKEFKLAFNSEWIAYTSLKNEWPKNHLSKKELKKEKKHIKKHGETKSDGKLLTIWNPITNEKKLVKNVSSFVWEKNGNYLAFVEQTKFKVDSFKLSVFDTKKNDFWKSTKSFTAIEGSNFGFSSSKLTGLYSIDTGEVKKWNLFVWNGLDRTFETIIDTSQLFVNKQVLSTNFQPYFFNNDASLFFGVAPMLKATPKDTLTEAEKVKLDIWHWKDERLQPQQLKELNSDKEETTLYAYHFDTKSSVQLGSDSLDIYIENKEQKNFLLANCDDQFAYETWNAPLKNNYYAIDIKTGIVNPLKSNVYFETVLSPTGKYFVYWNEKASNYYLYDIENKSDECITCKVKTNWQEDLNGQPTKASPLGVLAWTKEEKGLLIQAQKGIYHFDIASSYLSSITEKLESSKTDTNYTYQLTNLSSDSVYFQPNFEVLKQVDERTKNQTIYRIVCDFPNINYEKIEASNHAFVGFKFAKKGTGLLYQKMNVTDYPDLYIQKTTDDLGSKLTTVNPQQSEYNWSTNELITWESYSGIKLEGIIYKPENFDPNKSYPMIVYYYEMLSDGLHNHDTPRPTASIVFPTEYASAGYIVFIPNIRYKEGHPANSAYDCIMSGTDAVLKKYSNIDPKRIGLQGQSWGGYQTAQLITMTERYKCAMAGAPVSNMFSAYGGIRWGSGLLRQFQYEHLQSRIGKTIWEAPELYIENSPLFHLPKVKTPLLIMANDEDGAVPWYQGIELYAGLRRLQKPVWMLNYNGDDHNLMKTANRIDLSIRMRQFFDYYLLNAPAPAWLIEGLPAIEKGKTLKYNLIEN